MSDPTTGSTGPREDELIRAREQKLERWRKELGLQPYGERVDGLVSLAEARARFDEKKEDAWQNRAEGSDAEDPRERLAVAGRVLQHRDVGKLVFLRLRDHSGDLQVSISKAEADATSFKLAKGLDYGDIVVARGPIGRTKRGEICVWARTVEIHCKNLLPPPEKFHGMTDPELRYRRRYVDMHVNPEVTRNFELRSRLVTAMRRFMDERDYLEVETPTMQPIAGGAAARPFVTQHNAFGIQLFLRVAPELYLKRLLVGGMPRVYEIGRNFRNEGVDRQHNPEFTSLEVYQAFGNCETMLELTESLVHRLARRAAELQGVEGPPHLPFGDLTVNWERPFARTTYGQLFEDALGFPMTDEARVRAAAADHELADPGGRDVWLLVNELFEEHAEPSIDPAKPLFVSDYPSAISPLTRPKADAPHLSDRWELYAGKMELANAYTELNDPAVQLERFTRQLTGADDEDQTFRSLDRDFIDALRFGMPPAGGMGLGVDRLLMLLTGTSTIRDMILFPLMRPEGD